MASSGRPRGRPPYHPLLFFFFLLLLGFDTRDAYGLSARAPPPIYAPPAPPPILVFSGGTAFNSVAPALHARTSRVTHVLPISDNGGSSREISRFIGGPSIGDVRSRLSRLVPDRWRSGSAVLRLLEHRLTGESRGAARDEFLAVMQGTHPLWTGGGSGGGEGLGSEEEGETLDGGEGGAMAEVDKQTLQAFLRHFDTTVRLAEEANTSTTLIKAAADDDDDASRFFDWRHGSIGNFVFSGARVFFGSLDAAIHWFSRLAGIPLASRVVPVADKSGLTLAAALADGSVVVGQDAISHPPLATTVAAPAAAAATTTTTSTPSSSSPSSFATTAGATSVTAVAASVLPSPTSSEEKKKKKSYAAAVLVDKASSGRVPLPAPVVEVFYVESEEGGGGSRGDSSTTAATAAAAAAATTTTTTTTTCTPTTCSTSTTTTLSFPSISSSYTSSTSHSSNSNSKNNDSNDSNDSFRRVALCASDEVLRRLAAASCLVYAHGSLLTSIVPLLVVRGLAPAIATHPGRKVLVLNGGHDRETSHVTVPAANKNEKNKNDDSSEDDGVHFLTASEVVWTVANAIRSGEDDSSTSDGHDLDRRAPSLLSSSDEKKANTVHDDDDGDYDVKSFVSDVVCVEGSPFASDAPELDRIRRDLGIDVHVLPAAAEATTAAEMAMRLLPSRLEQGAASQLLPPPAQCACYDADALAECLLRLAST